MPSTTATADAEQLLAVMPVHLAGPGSEDVPFHLGAYFEWFRPVTADPDVVMISPCKRATLSRSPQSPAGLGRLTLTVRDDLLGTSWSATFDEQAPSEITASVLYAFAYGLDQWPGLVLHGAKGQQAAFDVLRQAGWPTQSRDGHFAAMSPDRLASLSRPLDAWEKETVLSGSAGHGTWSITFSAQAPAILAERAAVAITRRAPVLRGRGELPAAHLPHLTTSVAAEPPGRGTVAPRYLAGPGAGEPPRLITDQRWPNEPSRDGEAMTSPCGRLRVEYGRFPESWLVEAWPSPRRGPMDFRGWRAAFSPSTPREIVEEFLDVVADSLAADADLGTDATVVAGPGMSLGETLEPLTAAGWHMRLDSGMLTLLSPDGHASAHIDQGHIDPALGLNEILELERHFGMSIDMTGAPEHSWRAVLTGGTPLHLVRAATAAVANPAPVQRNTLDLPQQTRTAMAVTPPSPRPPARPAALAARVRTIPAQSTSPVATAPATALPPNRPSRGR
ncbi:DUF317 domain-containing protein [Kitasatospora sp. GAS1066B]|uniref:DUF317 domain-containing protein n=1 Tax=Kitasatospora sp. GAS1066B TaxID=3156271 RepID=UPI0035110D52